MKILVTTKAAGRPQGRRVAEGDWVRVGRNAASEIHLADPRVPLDQGVIVNRDGLVYLEGEGGNQSITRKSVRSVRLEPGQHVDVGPYRLHVQPPPAGFDGAIQVELLHPLQADAGFVSRARERTLGSIGLTKRWAAWLWALAVLLVFLAIPAGRVLDLPWREATQSAAFGDRFWNPGPVMLAHQPIETRCASCHEVAFQHVKDRACLECHATVGHHVGAEMNPAALFHGARCSTCHRDHKGIKSTHRDDDTMCVDCHRDLKAHAASATAAKVGDFARDHPAFRLSIPEETGVRRVRQGEGPLVEKSNLVFPHALHLEAKGVRSPLQGRMRLECKSCHLPDASRRGFEPISMPKHCQECHQLQFEPAVTTREVPHGKPAEALTMIEEFYASLALRGTPDSFQKAFGVRGAGLLRRAGDAGPEERRGALALANRKAQQVGAELFEVRVCKTCHDVSREAAGWKVAAIRPNHRWMPRAQFDHKVHLHVKCVDCHDVSSSRKASDVAMPSITRCRECHGGSRPVEGKVTSNCLLCHGFHDARYPWDPQFTPKGGARVAGRDEY
ncbi:MAG TPA: cytochrome c3 family protein [Usitatibacter sp.]|nr:cytochrome c3 family protein [Usitatibacter sp.]